MSLDGRWMGVPRLDRAPVMHPMTISRATTGTTGLPDGELRFIHSGGVPMRAQSRRTIGGPVAGPVCRSEGSRRKFPAIDSSASVSASGRPASDACRE
jgi:hypothetical protein